MRSLIIVGLLTLLPFILSAQQIFKWKMDVQEVAIDGVFHTYDTIVFWGVYADTICFRFNYKLACFYNVQNGVWSRYHRDLQPKIQRHIKDLRKDTERTEVNQTISIKQNKYNEIYIIRFLYGDAGVMIFATNVVFGVPSYNFRTVSLHK